MNSNNGSSSSSTVSVTISETFKFSGVKWATLALLPLLMFAFTVYKCMRGRTTTNDAEITAQADIELSPP
ncbi:hypothetical protein GOBAR_DD29742 [Gossypium barbadense]|nr:hypothetical protein GOBAR_DD29742 [Gossypium barbadense]